MKQCGRFVTEGLFVEDQINTLLGIFQKGLQFGHSSGGASIFDLHSGALSKGERFINVFGNLETQNLWSEAEPPEEPKSKRKFSAVFLELVMLVLRPFSINLATF
jgi:hypothetical protein